MRGFVEIGAYQRLADENRRLAEEVAWLRSELGLTLEASTMARLTQAFGISLGEAAILATLHAARTGVVMNQTLQEAPPPRGGHERNGRVAEVLISRLRGAIGRQTIETVRGAGYRLTVEGRRTVDSALAPPVVGMFSASLAGSREPAQPGQSARQSAAGGRATAARSRRHATA